MARRKVELAYITKKADRRASFRKRKQGLIKKARELSTLCDVDTCVVISPYEGKPAELWPDPARAQQVISRFQGMPEYQKTKKMESQEGFLSKRINIENEKLMKLQQQNKEEEVKEMIYQHYKGNFNLESLNNIPDLNDLGLLVDQKLQEINNRISMLSNTATANAASLPPPPPPPPPPPEVGSSSQPAEGNNNPNNDLDIELGIEDGEYFLYFSDSFL